MEKFDKVIIEELDTDDGILWTRNKLLDIGKLQIVGHTRKNEVEYNEENHTVYIDTSVYTNHKLSAVMVENNEIVEIMSVRTESEDVSVKY